MKRWPLLAALAYAVIVFAALTFVPAAPEASASGAKVVRYFQDHGGALRASLWLTTWATVPLVLLMAALRARLTGLGRDVMLIGSAGVVITGVVWSWFSFGLALHPSGLEPQVARTVADVSLFFGPSLTVLILLFIVPVGVAAWRGDGFPRWLAWVTFVFAVEQSIETITMLGKKGFIAPGGPMNFMLGAGLYLIWLVCAGAAVSSQPVPAAA
jgi:hypothetical protein